MPTVEFKARSNFSEAKAGFDALTKQMKGMAATAGSIGSTIKGGIATYFGVAAMKSIVDSMGDFADEIQNASDRLGVATDNIQSFRIAAKHAGQDLTVFDRIFVNMEKSFSDALGGGQEMDILKRFGLSEDDVKHLNKADALKKILEGSKKMPNEQANFGLTNIFGGKNTQSLMAMRDDIIDGNKDRIISADSISRMDALMDAFDDLKDTVIIGLIPALMDAITWVTNAIGGYGDATAKGNKLDAEAAALYYEKNGKHPNSVNSFMRSAQLQRELGYAQIKGAFTSPEEGKAAMERALKKYITNVYGEDIYEEVLKAFVPPPSKVDELRRRSEERAKETAEKEASRNAFVSREATIKKEGILSASSNLGNSSFISSGGILGVDAAYRIEKAQEIANGLLQRIANAVESIDRGSGISSSEADFAD